MDLHVERLEYQLLIPANTTFGQSTPVVWSLPDFEIKTDPAALSIRIDMKSHFRSEIAARSAVEPLLESWKIDCALRKGEVMFEYRFLRSIIVDRDPDPSRLTVLPATARASGGMVSATATMNYSAFPGPPAAFIATPDVSVMWTRWRAYQDGREPLPSMCYWLLTMLAYGAGGRTRAQAKYWIAGTVISRFARLTSNVGLPGTARKIAGAMDRRDLTPAEVQWLETTARILIRRVGEVAASPHVVLPQITMADLPPI